MTTTTRSRSRMCRQMSGFVRTVIAAITGATLVYGGVASVVAGSIFTALAPLLVGAVLGSAAVEEALEGDDLE